MNEGLPRSFLSAKPKKAAAGKEIIVGYIIQALIMTLLPTMSPVS